MSELKVLVIDDTIFYRKVVSDILAEIPNVKVVGTANNGKIALSKIKSLKPDLITLDIEMPEMTGIEVLEALQKENSEVKAIMLSTLTIEGGEMTIRALELGAFDFIPKPQAGNMADNKKGIENHLRPIVKAFTRRLEIQRLLKGRTKPKESVTRKETPMTGLAQRMQRITKSIVPKSEIVTIGISTGGPNALAQIMPKIPANIGVPFMIVQHMPPIFTQSLARSLNSKCAITVKEASDGDVIVPNTAFIAPGGKQMKLMPSGAQKLVKITDDPPENSCKPSADYLFRSVAKCYKDRVTAIIMTGMGSDGFNGLKVIKEVGAVIIAQDEASCTVFGMPKEPIEAGIVDVVAPLDNIVPEMLKTIRKIV